ncbi:MAG: Hsp20/alpha crystallin family protein [Clostridia bacterium]|nr:Hsp20/alpha crystallin family protein [Clostridia bacterium]
MPNIIRWDPWGELADWREAMDRFWNERGPMARWRRWEGMPWWGRGWAPAVDVYDRRDAIVVKADMPGVPKENMEVMVSDDSVTIRGEVKREESVNEKDYYRAERAYGSFSRTIPLPAAVDHQKATASFKDGILEITLPKAAGKADRRRLEIH